MRRICCLHLSALQEAVLRSSSLPFVKSLGLEIINIINNICCRDRVYRHMPNMNEIGIEKLALEIQNIYVC